MTEPSTGRPVEPLLWGALALACAGGAALYGWLSAEWAGSILLALAGVLAAVMAGYLAFRVRLDRAEAAREEPEDDAPYLPSSSVWPLELGAGMTLTLAGFAMGLWILLPGLVLVTHSLLGFLMQSRRRA